MNQQNCNWGGGGNPITKNYGVKFRLNLLKNDIFFYRYLYSHNPHSVTRKMRDIYFGYSSHKYVAKKSFLSFLTPKRYRQQGLAFYCWQKMKKLSYKSKKIEKIYNSLLKRYIKIRVILGKVDIPYFELVLTTKCTMRCESCNNLMQYFTPNQQYTCTLEGILQSLNILLSKVDSVGLIRVIGGEPLLFKELPQIIRFLDLQDKIRAFNIVTNGTMMFSNELLESLRNSHKVQVNISDYTRSPNLTLPLRHKQIMNALESYGISYSFAWSDDSSFWFNPGKIYKRNRNKNDIIKNFRACRMPCVSLMSGEGILCNTPNNTMIAPIGALFVCPIASSLSRLRGMDEFEGDFIDIANATRDRILEFYGQDFYKVCDYCHNMWEAKQLIPIAIQTKKILKIAP